MLERALQTATDEPCVERIVAVLDQHRALSETQEGTARVAKFRRADKHRAVDVMAPVRVRVYRRLAVDEGVEKGEWAIEPEPLGADLQDEERRVSGGLDVQGDELRFVQTRLGLELRRVDGDLFPRDWLHRSARFEEKRLGAHRLCASARRAQAISAAVTPRSNRTAPA